MQGFAFNAQEFDQWAATYDQDVLVDAFPFEGYERVLDTTLCLAGVEPGLRILDLGTGTGNLARRFFESGCRLWCADFSANMIAQAQRKLPEAVHVGLDLRFDLSTSCWPQVLAGPFDRIVSGYVFHHFTLDEKTGILKWMAGLLADGGRILIADIAFQDNASLEAARREAGDDWEEEYYWNAEVALPALEQAGLPAVFHRVSSCAGVFMISPA